MEAPKETDKCKVSSCTADISQTEDECYLCALCKTVKYCSDKCRNDVLYVPHLPQWQGIAY